MTIRFLVDFRGKLTGERFYRAGEEVDGLVHAAALVREGRAVLVTPPKATPAPKPKAAPKATPKKRTRK